MKAFVYLRELRDRLFGRWGFVPKTHLVEYAKALNRELDNVRAEKRRHTDTFRKLDEANAFIDGKLQHLTRLEPVMRWPKISNEPVDYVVEPYDVARARVMEFVEGRRKDVVICISIPAVFDYWRIEHDLRAVDEAINYVAKAAAHKISQTLRFGLTGKRDQ